MLPEQKIVIMNHFHLLFVPQKLSTVWVYKGAEMTGLGLKGLGGWQGEDRGCLPVFLFILGLTPLVWHPEQNFPGPVEHLPLEHRWSSGAVLRRQRKWRLGVTLALTSISSLQVLTIVLQ